jgi:hypothetical protein
MVSIGQGDTPLVMTEDKTRKRLPPYISYRSFHNFLEELQQGVPARIDRSYWGTRYSGSVGVQLVAALRFLGLIDVNAAPTDRLRKLTILKGGSRADHLKQMTLESFSFLASVNMQTATYGQLDEAFHAAYQLAPNVKRKCIKFYIDIAKDAGITLSSFITTRVRSNGSGTGIKGISKRKNSKPENPVKIPQEMELVPNNSSWDELLLDKFPKFDPAWNDELKLNWFKGFDVLIRIRPGKDGVL